MSGRSLIPNQSLPCVYLGMMSASHHCLRAVVVSHSVSEMISKVQLGLRENSIDHGFGNPALKKRVKYTLYIISLNSELQNLV